MTRPGEARNSVFTRACIALGSNLGDREATIRAALDALDGHDSVRVLAVSSRYETAPVGPCDQPRFINAAAAIETTLTARGLLDLMLEIERRHGRDRGHETRWGPRTLDLDLLLFDDAIIDEDGLTVPHPRMAERLFVLEPLCEIAPEAVHPVTGLTVREMLENCVKG